MISSSLPRWNSIDSGTPAVKNIGSMPVNVFCAMIRRPSVSTRSLVATCAAGNFRFRGTFTSSHPSNRPTDQLSDVQPVPTRDVRARAARPTGRTMTGTAGMEKARISGIGGSVESDPAALALWNLHRNSGCGTARGVVQCDERARDAGCGGIIMAKRKNLPNNSDNDAGLWSRKRILDYAPDDVSIPAAQKVLKKGGFGTVEATADGKGWWVVCQGITDVYQTSVRIDDGNF